MNFHQLLDARSALLRQARLANLAYAHQRLSEFAERIVRARLCTTVSPHQGDQLGGQPWPGLHVLEGSPAVLEEHFLEEELVELADILGFLGLEWDVAETPLRLDELAGRFLPPLRRELEAAGIAVPSRSFPGEESIGEDS